MEEIFYENNVLVFKGKFFVRCFEGFILIRDFKGFFLVRELNELDIIKMDALVNETEENFYDVILFL